MTEQATDRRVTVLWFCATPYLMRRRRNGKWRRLWEDGWPVDAHPATRKQHQWSPAVPRCPACEGSGFLGPCQCGWCDGLGRAVGSEYGWPVILNDEERRALHCEQAIPLSLALSAQRVVPGDEGWKAPTPGWDIPAQEEDPQLREYEWDDDERW